MVKQTEVYLAVTEGIRVQFPARATRNFSNFFGAENNPHKPARTWYRTQLDWVAQRYPYIARDVREKTLRA